ncbi:MAG TPA: lactate utilization protein [Candidatus Angelobacter sp.]|nr:lactate utilization protein [Candidatus Angelobacter sp.]
MSTIETVDPSLEGWDRIPGKQIITRTIDVLKSRGINAELVNTSGGALKVITARIPEGAEVMTGSSTSLDQIGFTDLLKSGAHQWKNLKQELMSEKDPAKQRSLRVRATGAEYFIGSVQAVAETGEIVVASASGSQIPAYAFNARNVLWVVGAQKIVRNLEEALRRVREHALPLETARMKSQGYPGSMIGKILILEREPPQFGRNLTMILVNEKLGF